MVILLVFRLRIVVLRILLSQRLTEDASPPQQVQKIIHPGYRTGVRISSLSFTIVGDESDVVYEIREPSADVVGKLYMDLSGAQQSTFLQTWGLRVEELKEQARIEQLRNASAEKALLAKKEAGIRAERVKEAERQAIRDKMETQKRIDEAKRAQEEAEQLAAFEAKLASEAAFASTAVGSMAEKHLPTPAFKAAQKGAEAAGIVGGAVGAVGGAVSAAAASAARMLSPRRKR